MANDIAASGVLLVDKPYGPTSHAVVAWLRREFGQRSIGHCGTLDPAATGLLVVCLGGATRLAEYFSGADKCYDATIVLGATTSTDDAQGDVLSRSSVSSLSLDLVKETLVNMVGPLELSPPTFSAIRVNGQRSFRRARMGEEVTLAPRSMSINRIDHVRVLTRNSDQIEIAARLWVSKGTYIRSIAYELGACLGVGGYLGALRRIGSAHLSLNESCVLSVDAECVNDSSPSKWRLSASATVESSGGVGAVSSENNLKVGEEIPVLRIGTSKITALERYLRPVWEYLPFPYLDCESSETKEIFRRLELGQRISGQGTEATILFNQVARNAPKFCLIRSSNGSLVVVRHEFDKSGYPRFAPERVVRRS